MTFSAMSWKLVIQTRVIDMKRMSPATRRYLGRMAVSAALYVAILFAVSWAYHHGRFPDGVWRYLVALAPTLPVLGMCWAMLRFSREEEDEYQRFLHNRAILGALSMTIVLCTGWGLLETYAGAENVSLIHVFGIYWVSQGVATVWTRLGAAR